MNRIKLLYFFLVPLFIFVGCSDKHSKPVELLQQTGEKMAQNPHVEYSYLIKWYRSYAGDTSESRGTIYFAQNPNDTVFGLKFYNKSLHHKSLNESKYGGRYLILLNYRDSSAFKKPFCDFSNGHMTVYPYVEYSYGAIQKFLNDTALYSDIDSLKFNEYSKKGKKYLSFDFWTHKRIVDTYKVGQKRRVKVKLIIRRSDFLPVFYSQYEPLKRNDYHYVKAFFNNYAFDKGYPDSLFTLESVPSYFKWDKYKRFLKLLPVGTLAPDWTLPGVSGDSVTLSSLRGKFVLLDFWFIGCGSCIESIPVLNELQKQYDDIEFKVIGINCFNNNEEKIKRYCNNLNMNYKNVRNGDAITGAYRIKGAPMFYLIDKKGKIVYTQVGHDSKKLSKAVAEALTEESL